MLRENIDKILEEVIREAQAIGIPVPVNINRQVQINSRPKKRFGCCKVKGDRCYIEISGFILDSDERKIREVIAHEVLHACDGCRNHGALWKVYAMKMKDAYGYDIKRVSSFEEMGLEEKTSTPEEERIKYIIKCEKCGMEYPRQRYTCVMQKINAYRCRCGGSLTLIKK